MNDENNKYSDEWHIEVRGGFDNVIEGFETMVLWEDINKLAQTDAEFNDSLQKLLVEFHLRREHA